METRRKEVGSKIKQGRRLAKYRSQEAFAKAVGYNETTVGNAERGSDRVGDAVYEAIEAVLGWPIGSTAAYIAGTGKPPWELSQSATADAPGPKDPMPSQVAARTEFSAELRAKWRQMSVDEIIERGAEIEETTALEFGVTAGRRARIKYLRAALQEQEDQLSVEDVPQ